MASLASPAPSKRFRTFLVLGLALLVALIAGLLVSGSNDGSGGGPDKAATEVFLEPAASVGEAAFAGGGDVNDAPAPLERSRAETDDGDRTPGRSLRSVVGSAAGLYAAARGVSPCDVDKLTDALAADTTRKAAWTRAAGVTPDGMNEYLRDMTGLVLRADTRVTDFGFEGSRAVARQAVLQSGTAVLVDAFGSPAVRCQSGNPLGAPLPARTDAEVAGEPWTGFAPERALIVTRAPAPVELFVVVNLTVPGYFTRPVGTEAAGADIADGDIVTETVCDLFPEECLTEGVPPGSGSDIASDDDSDAAAVSVTLQWFSAADLDLAVTDPSGATVRYDSQSVDSGGALDHDANGGCRAPTSAPAETVSWPADSAPNGDYTITVSYYDVCPGGEGAQSYTLSISGASVSTTSEPSDAQALGDAGRMTLVAHVHKATDRSAVLGRQASGGSLGGAGDSATNDFSVGAREKSGPPPDLFSFDATAIGGGRVLVQWIPGTPAPGQALELGYELVVEPGGTVVRFAPDELDFSFVGEQGKSYTFTMVAINRDGESAPSSGSATVIGKPDVDLAPEEETTTTAAKPEPTASPQPPPETLEQYCTRLYGPAPESGHEAENMMWTLCMHDPT